MNNQFPHLFSKFRIRNCELNNRVVSTGHHTYLSDSEPNDRLVAYHKARAKGGVGLIISEVVAVHDTAKFSNNLLRVKNAEAIPAYRKLVDGCKQHGTKIFAQLFHPGREILSSYSGLSPIAWAPSAVPNERFHIMPKPMSVSLIEDIVQGYGTTATHLAQAGFDGFEIVASHGYLPGQFLNPQTNLRDDDYGGDFNRRLNFIKSVSAEIKRNAPELVVGLRLSASDCDDNGMSIDEIIAVSSALESDMDYLSFVAGTSASLGGSVHIVPPMGLAPGYIASYTEKIRKNVSIPVMVAGRINHLQLAESILSFGQADLCGMTRALICDPDMVNKARDGDTDNIRACIACNQSCIGRAHKGLSISCIQHPESGRELRYKKYITPSHAKNIMVVGSGPAGMKAASIVAARGHRVSIYEKSSYLGGQVNLAMKLPGREEFGGMIDNLKRELISAGVKIITNSEVTVEQIHTVQPDCVILATGAVPYCPDLEGIDGSDVMTAWELINGVKKSGARVVIADWRADWIGLGIAEKLIKEGCDVTLCCNASMAGESLQIYTRNHYVGRIRKLGVNLITHARLFGIDQGNVYFQDTLTQEPIVLEDTDTLVLSLGHVPFNTLELSLENSNCHYVSIGDCVSARTAEEAIYEGLEVAWAI